MVRYTEQANPAERGLQGGLLGQLQWAWPQAQSLCKTELINDLGKVARDRARSLNQGRYPSLAEIALAWCVTSAAKFLISPSRSRRAGPLMLIPAKTRPD